MKRWEIRKNKRHGRYQRYWIEKKDRRDDRNIKIKR